MRVFLTGATGFVGEAIVREPLTAKHQGARTGAQRRRRRHLGAVGAQGRAVSDTDTLAAGARACEGVIHAGFIRDFSAYAAAAETDRRL